MIPETDTSPDSPIRSPLISVEYTEKPAMFDGLTGFLKLRTLIVCKLAVSALFGVRYLRVRRREAELKEHCKSNKPLGLSHDGFESPIIWSLPDPT